MNTPWELLAKYISQEASESERVEVEKWAGRAEANSVLLERLSLLFQNNDQSHKIDFSQFKGEDWERLHQKTILGASKENEWAHMWKMAASISLIIAALASILYFIKQAPLLEITTTDQTQEVWLPDSSHVLLNKHSNLVVEAGYLGENRKVSLKGEAFFKVRSNPQSPFSVRSYGVSTTVLGTEFNIKARTDSAITVSVVEGKVNVAAKDQQQLLTTNMSAIYNGQALQLAESPNPNYLAWKTGVIHFESETLLEALTFLSDHYGNAITLDSDVDPKTLITVELNNLSLSQSIEIITFTLDLQFVKGSKGYRIYKINK